MMPLKTTNDDKIDDAEPTMIADSLIKATHAIEDYTQAELTARRSLLSRDTYVQNGAIELAIRTGKAIADLNAYTIAEWFMVVK